MLNRLLAGLVIWAIVAGCFALSESPVRASQDVAAPADFVVPYTPQTVPRVVPDPTVDQEMRVRQHHARINMILYTGRIGDSELAATARQLDAIALR
jgi:hypothetical protein